MGFSLCFSGVCFYGLVLAACVFGPCLILLFPFGGGEVLAVMSLVYSVFIHNLPCMFVV